jgi:hypothetical protein
MIDKDRLTGQISKARATTKIFERTHKLGRPDRDNRGSGPSYRRTELAKYETWDMAGDFTSHLFDNAKSFTNAKREGVGRDTKGKVMRGRGYKISTVFPYRPFAAAFCFFARYYL